ncbi:MAG: bifunctional diaminohydroxyphosphoribosylaminopyrimidine deaminase/5-amino-6-(5-phosphoribosylamino)uracil reductase RibD [Alphaproteobacteria bacterium]|nr:bifunctional diaminohydroxyphosphoribosylaminopyrimidine deaminase/5-amino-6-(5-phosphoribosylamino)uracil reductase RibD [Alphaproteobacteria bacterium]MCY4318806.1 bifunctional diaminohydroxyphosphoribosylaminopyrimidine deaminase/5-amino-6-(5-phosphoribosylamino)uracil reductase RibD [Alphaproteobacteria bacterium]
MEAALALGRRGLGRVWPNPAVGCVLVLDGRVVGRGWTQPGGRPHAEAEALARAGADARGATCYVTLEPCSHHGRAPPCATALIEAGVARVVAAIEDPDPRVSGRGFARLEAAGIAVERGPGEAMARFDNAGFLTRIVAERPLIALKMATTLDGRIASRKGVSRWITSPEARAAGHRLRAGYDAVMVGARTALLDNPRLDCRLDGLRDRAPLRIVADSRLGLPPTHHLVAGSQPCWALCRDDADKDRAKVLEDAGVRLIGLPAGEDGRMDLAAGLRRLGEAGLTRLLVEGGGQLAAALLKAELVDRIHWFRAPAVMGGDGQPAVAALGVDTPGGAPRFCLHARRMAGNDIWEVWRRCSPA